jgi:hypothetical protein
MGCASFLATSSRSTRSSAVTDALAGGILPSTTSVLQGDMRAIWLFLLILGCALAACTVEVFSDEGCMTRLAPDNGGPCPTPQPFPGTRYQPTGFQPADEIAALCDAFNLVFEEIKPAINAFADPAFREDADAMTDAGDTILDAAAAMNALFDEDDESDYATAARELSALFEADGHRAREGSIRDDDARMRFADLVSEYGAECYGAHPGREPLTRGRVASLLVEELNLPASATDHFTDDDDSTFEAAIDSVAEAGVMLGCSETEFCLGDVVTRGAMAEIVVRAYALPDTEEDFFVDDDGSPHEDAINRVAAANVLEGQRDGTIGADTAITPREIQRWFQRLRRL